MSDKDIQEILERLARIETLINTSLHNPGTCPLAERVRSIELREAKQAGIFAVVGFLILAISTSVATYMARIWSR